MAEEMPQPKRQVSQVMVLSALLSAVSGFIMILVYMFCITNSDNLLAPIGGQPIAQLMVDSFDSLTLTIIGVVLFIICFIFACCTMMTTFSRVWWSFAREGGVPFSGTMSHVTKDNHVPANAVYFGFASCALIGLLELGSATALNAILGAGILFIFMSYAVTLVCSLLTKRRILATPHYFNLGQVGGTILNCISVAWICFVFVWLCFPLYVPVTGNTMNFAIVVFFIVILISAINWFCYSTRHFKAPEPMAEFAELEVGV
jgi:amino acid transporter